MNILYIDGVGVWGGASRSLYESISNLEDETINKYFLIVRGSVVNKYEELAEEIIICKGLSRFDNTEYSYYRGVRWLVLLREIYHLPFTIYGFIKAWHKWRNKIDLIHVNEITEIIPLIFAKIIFRKPVICHVRSVARLKSNSIRTRVIKYLLENHVTKIIAIDENVKSSLKISSSNLVIIHNSFTPNNRKEIDMNLRQSLEKIDKDVFKLGFVGNLLYSKGILDLVLATKKITSAGFEIKILIVGDDAKKNNRIFNEFFKMFGLRQDMKSEMINLISKLGLENNFVFLGSTFDIQSVYKLIDVNCFPSHFDAPGRPVFEAAFFKVPSIVSVSNPYDDTLINMETGIAINCKQPDKLYDAIRYFIENPEEVTRMGNNAYNLANINFDSIANSKKLKEIYYNVFTNQQ
jgi:glycosyltransferase involved in cell wall biosynthesis